MARTAIKFGTFVAVCLVLTMYLAATIGNTSLLGLVGQGESTYTVQARFDDVSGLLVNDNVKVAGVPVGKVTGVDVEEGKALVTMEVHSDRVLPADSTAAIRWRNLIGQRYVYLLPGDATTRLEDGDLITRTSNVVHIGELFNELGPIVATIDEGKVNDFLEAVTRALEGNEAEVSRTLDDLAFVVQRLGERDEAIARMVGNLEVVSRTVADRDAQIETLLDNLAVLSQTFSDNTELLESAIVEVGAFNRDFSHLLQTNRAEIDGIITSLDNTLNTVEANLGPVSTALDKLDEGAAAAFNTSRNGEFLNQAVLCLTTQPPPCPNPIVPGFDGVTGSSATEPVAFTPGHRRGGDAVLSLLIGDGGGAR